jgi:4-alpha-glucanotransferase
MRIRQAIALERLAASYGIQTNHIDVFKKKKIVKHETLCATLRLRGASLRRLSDAPEALRERHAVFTKQVIEPVGVVWDGRYEFELSIPEAISNKKGSCELELEDHCKERWAVDLSRASVQRSWRLEGVRYVSKRIPVPYEIPWGYHTLHVELSGKRYESFLISSPRRAWTEQSETKAKNWGIFLPLYAARSKRNWGSGDLTDLAKIEDWVESIGGQWTATTPLFSTFLEKPYDPSPYNPVSRLFWNECYLDCTQVPEFIVSQQAQGLVRGRVFQKELARLRQTRLVDWRGVMALKRQVLEELVKTLLADPSSFRCRAFQRFMDRSTEAREYARFRAAHEKQKKPWQEWPTRLRDGSLNKKDYRTADCHYHLYVQWIFQDALQGLPGSKKSKRGLVLDLPLGVHPAGFDAWKYRNVFCQEAKVGAPPDTVFTGGQDWGFAPFDPDALRKSQYRYFRSCIENIFQYAAWVRLDHVMSFHRLYWIPPGAPKAEGAYVRYPEDEFYAVLVLESHRKKTQLVGENLGTVPRNVNRGLSAHGIRKMYVVQYELSNRLRTVLPSAPVDTVASLNTHDMPPFAASWRGLDIEDRLRMGLLTEKEVLREKRERVRLQKVLLRSLRRMKLLKERTPGEYKILQAAIWFLAKAKATCVLVNLEDLWLETRPQNVPGTGPSEPNWVRKARYSFEEFSEDPFVLETLAGLDGLRKQALK